MSQDLYEQLRRLGNKAELLTTRFATLRDENVRLRGQVAELEAQLNAARADNERLSLDVEFLRISAAIAPDREATLRAKALIANLVREIDACVADLMKDI